MRREDPEAAVAAGTAPARALGRVVRLRLVAWRVEFRDEAEMLRAMRHRYLLAYYLGFAGVGCVLALGLNLAQAPVDVLAPAVVLGMAALLVMLHVYLLVAIRVMRVLGREGPVWVTPGLVVGTVVMKLVAATTHEQLGSGVDWSFVWTVSNWVLSFILAEALATIVFRGPLPKALRAMRAAEGAADGVVPVQAAKLVAQEPGEPVPDLLRAGSLRLPMGRVQRLEANGNYVLVVTASGRHLVPGPFSDVAGQLPDRLGRRVHRSHWVAAAAVSRLVKSGRDLWIVAAGDAVVPVGATLHQQVQVWLEERGMVAERGPVARPVRAGA